jgi:hypothetical protein
MRGNEELNVMKLVKVKNFPYRLTAEQAQLRLKEEGIESLLQPRVAGFFGMLGHVDLYVREELEQQAREILDDLIGDV